MSESELYSIISKKLAGEISDVENVVFTKWLNKSKENKELFREQKEIWKVESHYKKKKKEEWLYGRVLEGINKTGSSQNTKAISYFARPYVRYVAAACLVLLVALSAIFYSYQRENKTSVLLSYIEKINPKGQKSRIHLPDGSVVMLNAGSSLRYPSEFSRNFRELELIGEAYFEVAKDKYRPFIVKTGDISTTALGTAFNVRAFLNEDVLEIALTEGEVRVDKVGTVQQEYYLSPGECVRYEKNSSDFKKETFSVMEAAAWKDGVLVFKDASMEKVLERLELWYDVEFEIEGDSVLPIWNYSGQFTKEYLNRVLESISYSQDFKFNIKGKKVLINY